MRRVGLVSALAAVFALAAMSATSVAAGTLPTLTLQVTKNTITVGGSTVSGAVNIATTVSGEAEDNPALILLKPGVTPQQFGAFVSKLGKSEPLDAIDPYGTIVFDSQNALKGKTTMAQVILQPGTYVAVNNGNGHSVFTVTSSSSPASLPKPGATVKAIDFAFRGADTLHRGELVRFENDGFLIHMVLFHQARNLADAKRAATLLVHNKVKEIKKLKLGTGVAGMFAGPLSHGAMQQETINEPAGAYVIYCAMNAEDGREHYELGMVRVIRIVK